MGFIRRLIRGKVEEVKDWEDPDREENPMPCPEIEIQGIDRELVGKFISQAISAGAEVDGARVTLHGISLDWDYDEVSQTLHITALKHPFYFSCGEIDTKIRELVAKAKAGI
jgi:hypothetical protein